MTGGETVQPIGERDLDRLLALVPPPPKATPGLADRIAARAAATSQLPALPPQGVSRATRGRGGRRGAWAGAVLSSFLLTVAAAAAVMGSHIDLNRLASLPTLLFDRHPAHLPAQPANVHAPRPSNAASAAITTRPPAVVATVSGAPVRPAGQAESGRASVREGMQKDPVHAAAHAPHAQRKISDVRSLELHRQKKAIAIERRDQRPAASARQTTAMSATLQKPGSRLKEDGAAEANREALRTTERAAPEAPQRKARMVAPGANADVAAGGRRLGQSQHAQWRADDPNLRLTTRTPKPRKKRGRWR